MQRVPTALASNPHVVSFACAVREGARGTCSPLLFFQGTLLPAAPHALALASAPDLPPPPHHHFLTGVLVGAQEAAALCSHEPILVDCDDAQGKLPRGEAVSVRPAVEAFLSRGR